MEYPWNKEILIQAAEPETEEPKVDSEPDPESGTNEPVGAPEGDVPAEDKPDPELAGDIAGTEPSGSDVQTQIEDLKKQLDEINKKFDLETEVNILKKRLENVHVPDETDLNDSLNQTASKISFVKRAIRRILSKKSCLTGAQQQLITTELDQHPQLSCQQMSAKLAKELGASEQDIYDFIRYSDYRYRHRHWREI